jgi:hypothetical protein
MSVIFGLFLARYFPYMPGKLLLEYIAAEYLSFKSEKFINDDVADLIHT